MNCFRIQIICIVLFGMYYVALYAQSKNDEVIKVPPTANNFAYPQSVFVDSPHGNIWVTDFSNNRVLRFDVIAKATLGITALIEGFYNGTTMVSDTVTVELRNSTIPYSLVESKKIVLNTSGSGSGNFTSAINGTPYYIVVKHRNAVETWSASAQSFSGGTLSYNFTSGQFQAFGGNQINKGSKWCLYSGDVYQDGIVDSGDLGIIDNDNANYVSGYFNTDVNGDGIVDSGDLGLVDNNNAAYVGKIVPTGVLQQTKLTGSLK